MLLNRIRNIATVNTIYNYLYDYQNRDKHENTKFKKPKNRKHRKLKLSPEEKKKLNRKVIDIMELYELERGKSQKTKAYKQLHNIDFRMHEPSNRVNRAMNAYGKSEIIDFNKRKESIRKNREQINRVNAFTRKQSTQSKSRQASTNNNRTPVRNQRSFRESVMVGQKTPKEVAYERAWADFEKAIKQKRMLDTRNIRKIDHYQLNSNRQINFNNRNNSRRNYGRER